MNIQNTILCVLVLLVSAPISLFIALQRFLVRLLGLKVEIPQKHKNVFITGCDTGFGYLAALKFSENGFKVFAGCLTENGANRLLDIDKYRRNIITLQLDVTSQESVDAAVRKVKEQLGDSGGLWALINNAGIAGAIYGNSLTTMKDYEVCMNVNFTGQIRVMKAFLPMLNKTKVSGRLVQTASVFGNVAIGGLGPYMSSKFAILGAIESLRKEIIVSPDQNVTVCLVCPGFHDTALVSSELTGGAIRRRLVELDDAELKAKYNEEYVVKAATTMQHITERFAAKNDPSDVADAYYDACTSRSPKPNYWVGQDALWFWRTMIRTLLTMPLFIFYCSPEADFSETLKSTENILTNKRDVNGLNRDLIRLAIHYYA